ncbi:MAG: hypothetical protein PHC50_03525 [Candidatus Cloacimonetes bacterium]|nr:hypothetical protein [Candidatus Cloacimonadota bacterium]
MLIVVAIAGLVIVVYFVFKNRTNNLQDTVERDSMPDEQNSLGINIGLWENDEALRIAHYLFGIYQTSSRSEAEYHYRSRLEVISRHLFDLKEHVGNEHIKKSKKYVAIISEYNRVADQYKRRKDKLLADSKSISPSSDMRHCPSCLEDIGKEVARVRMCPKCGEKILIFRSIPDNWFLVNESQNTKLKEMWSAVANYQVPNILDAFCYSEKVAAELERMIDKHVKEEEKKKKAKNLTIDY